MSAAPPAVPSTAVALPSGAQMPLLGFGTWRLTGQSAVEATQAALDAGYRHLDTATLYGNEREVGRALRASGRDGVFVTTKLPPDRADRARETLEQSLEALGVDQVDLWLIHWPPDAGGPGLDLWERFVAAREDGLVRDIGVSKYPLDLVDALAGAGVTPAVNQIRWSPLLYDAAHADGHRERGVVLGGFSALRGGALEHPTVAAIAERLGRTPAQVIVRWHLEHGFVVIPKSADPDRIRANADVDGFALTAEDVRALDALGG